MFTLLLHAVELNTYIDYAQILGLTGHMNMARIYQSEVTAGDYVGRLWLHTMNSKRLALIIGVAALAALLVVVAAFHASRLFGRRVAMLRPGIELLPPRAPATGVQPAGPELATLVRRTEPAGVVVFIEGQAKATEPGKPERPLGMQSPVFQGERIVTGARSIVHIRFADGALFAQGEASSFVIEAYLYDAKSPATPASCKFGALLGAFRFLTGAIAARNPENFQAVTTRAIIGIRGCEVGVLTGIDADLVFAISLAQNENLVITPAMNQGAARSLTIKQPGLLASVKQDGSVFQRQYTAEEIGRLPRRVETGRPAQNAAQVAPPTAIPAAAGGPQPLPSSPFPGEHYYSMMQFPRDLKLDIFPHRQLPHLTPESQFKIVDNGYMRFRRNLISYIEVTSAKILPSAKAGSSLFNVLSTTTIPTQPSVTGFGI